MKTSIKTISKNLSANPSKASQAFISKHALCILVNVFGSCLLFGIVLFLYNNALQTNMVDSDKNSAIERDPAENTKSKFGNGSIVHMVTINSSGIALNTSDAYLNSDAQTTIIHPSGKSYVYNKTCDVYSISRQNRLSPISIIFI